MQAQRREPEGVVAREEDPAVAHAAARRLARLDHSQRHPLLEQPRRHRPAHLRVGLLDPRRQALGRRRRHLGPGPDGALRHPTAGGVHRVRDAPGEGVVGERERQGGVRVPLDVGLERPRHRRVLEDEVHVDGAHPRRDRRRDDVGGQRREREAGAVAEDQDGEAVLSSCRRRRQQRRRRRRRWRRLLLVRLLVLMVHGGQGARDVGGFVRRVDWLESAHEACRGEVARRVCKAGRGGVLSRDVELQARTSRLAVWSKALRHRRVVTGDRREAIRATTSA